MPRFVLTEMDLDPGDLDAQLPAIAVAARMLPGADRPDYCIARLENPIKFHLPPTFDVSRAPLGPRPSERHEFLAVGGD